MNRTLLALAALAACLPAAAGARTIQGVAWDAVPWETICPGVEAVPLQTESGSCPVTHPASPKHARWDGFGMGVKEPRPNCERLEREYRKWTSPKLVGGKPSSNPNITWGFCMGAFSRALELRASEPERFPEPLAEWRERYFGPWLVRGAR